MSADHEDPPTKRHRLSTVNHGRSNPKFFRLRAHANPLAESAAMKVPSSPAAWDSHWATLFPAVRDNPKRRVAWVDVGCGFGRLVTSLAVGFPSVLVLGMEIREKVSAAAQERIIEQRKSEAPGVLGNAAVIRANCMRCLPQFFTKGQLEKLTFCFLPPRMNTLPSTGCMLSAWGPPGNP